MPVAALPDTGLHRLTGGIVTTLGKTGEAVRTVKCDEPLLLIGGARNIRQELAAAVRGIIEIEHTHQIEDSTTLRTLDSLRLPLSLKLVDTYTLLC